MNYFIMKTLNFILNLESSLKSNKCATVIYDN